MTESDLKYNFVFFFVGSDYWKALIGKDNDHKHVYEWTLNDNCLINIINHIFWSNSINTKHEVKLKKLFFKKMYKQNFKSDLPLCFVYLGGNSIRFDSGWCDYVRKRDRRNRQVIFHGDLISKKIHFDYDLIRKKVDLCATYDPDEAKEYGIAYINELNYELPIERRKINKHEYDVYFVANIKDRYDTIMGIYYYLVNNGVKCKFVLVGVPKEKQVELNGIEYSDGITYKENLENVIKSKCILDIIQGNSSGATLRTKEALAYGRRLITNCKNIENKWFNKGQLLSFNKACDINVEDIKADMSLDGYKTIVNMDTDSFLYAIQDALENE